MHLIFNNLFQLAFKCLLKIKSKERPKQIFKTGNENKKVQKLFK